MTEPRDIRTRRRVTTGAALGVALVVVGVGVWQRLEHMHRQQLDYWRQALAGGALTTQLTVDDWYAERVADAEDLASSAALVTDRDARDLAPLRPRLQSALRRPEVAGVWVVNAAGAVLAASGADTLFAAEREAAARAAASAKTVHSRLVAISPVRTFLTIAAPVAPSSRSSSHPIGQVVLLRVDVIAAFSPWATGRPNAAQSVLVAPGTSGLVIVRVCPTERPPICISTRPAADSSTPVALALSGRHTFGELVSVDGVPVLAATRYDSTMGWGIVRRIATRDAFAFLRREAAIEGALLAALLALAGLGAFTASRVGRLRRLHAQSRADLRLATVVDASIDGLFSLDDAFQITLANASTERLFGRSRTELRGRPVLELFAAEERDMLAEQLGQMRASIAGTPRERIGATALHLDRGPLPVSLVLARAPIEGEGSLLTMGVHDLSERAHAEAFLTRQRQVLELIASSPPMRQALDAVIGIVESEAPAVQCAAYELQDDGVVLTLVAAPTIPADFAIATEEVITGPVSDAVGTAVFRGEPVFSADIASDPLWARSRAYVLSYGLRGGWAMPLRGADGVLIGALAFYLREARDPTPREVELSNTAVHLASIAMASSRDAASLRGSEASFRSFVQNAPAAIFRETRLGHLVTANAAMVALLGYVNAEALVAAGDAGQLYDDDQARRALLASLESSDVVRGVELEWRRADRTRVTVRLSARAYRDDRARVWLWEGYAEDVTPLRQAEHALRRSEKLAAVGQLISGVAHELNNPLSSILHFADDLLADPRTPGDAEALGVIREQARRSRSIVRDLLSFVQQRQANVQVVVLGATVAATVRAMSPAAQRSGVALHVGHLDDVSVLVDLTGLEQVITNLLSNAMHAAGAGGEVRVRTECIPGWCRLVVDDTGPGIAPDVLPRIFDPFFTTKPTGEGTGLGLSVTLGIVQQLGGRIVTEPLPPGVRGTRFVATLPLPRAGAAEEVARAPSLAVTPPQPRAVIAPVATHGAPAMAGPPRSVLVIDDEATIRAALCRFFTRRGWRVEEAEDGSAALALIGRTGGGYDLVVSDLRMPGFSGVDLHDHLAANDPGLLRRVIFSTGDVASHDAASFVQRTRCPVLKKPFELRTLDEIVERLLEGTVPGGVVG